MAKPTFTAEWFPYYWERFEESDRVSAMTLTEEGAYHRAIRLAWRWRSLPADPVLFAAKIQKRCTAKIAIAVLTTFVPDPEQDGRVIHPVVEEIRCEQEKRYLNRVKGGKAAHAKHEKEKTSSITPAQLEHYSSSYLISHSKDDLKRLMDACVRANAKTNKKAVELGILYTLLQRNGSNEPIRSVQYFTPEISKMAKQTKGMSDQAIDALIERRRQQLFGEEVEKP